jgi:hypothetical protein
MLYVYAMIMKISEAMVHLNIFSAYAEDFQLVVRGGGCMCVWGEEARG